jgi:hypothetical protein
LSAAEADARNQVIAGYGRRKAGIAKDAYWSQTWERTELTLSVASLAIEFNFQNNLDAL